MFMRRRPLRRVAGMAAVGGVGYYAGRKKAQAEEAQDDRAQADAAQAQAAQAEAAKAQAEQAEDDDIERLKKLAELRDSGVLTEEEFQQEKKKILAAD